MNKKIAILWLSAIMLFSFVVIIVEIAPVVKAPIIIYVDDVPGEGPGNPAENYTSIQDAINNANPGDTIFVYSGIYYEHILVDKSINLIGENKNNTIIDGKGSGDVVLLNVNFVDISNFTVTGSGSGAENAGIKLDNVWSCWVFNNNVSDNNRAGIYLYYSNDNTISNNNASSNYKEGIRFWYSNGNNITGNKLLFNNWSGVRLYYSNWNNIIGNNYSNVKYAVDFHYSEYNNLSDNTMKGDGIFMVGDILEHWNTHDIATSNTVNGKPLYYWKNQDGGIVPPGAGQIILANCTNITIENQGLTYGSTGIELGFSSENYIINNDASNNWRGMYMAYSNQNNIINNDFSSNDYYGLYVLYSHNNNITGNDASSNHYTGIVIWGSNRNQVMGNYAPFCGVGLDANGGISISSATENIISGNNVSSNNKNGIYLSGSDDNVIIDNSVLDNYQGINLLASHQNSVVDNTIFNNNFGINMFASNENTIIQNNALHNGQGIHLYASSNNIIDNNKVLNNDDGIISSQSSMDNEIINNNVSYNNMCGIFINSSSNNNDISNNIILNNENGINISSSSNNKIFHNNIINNTIQAYDNKTDNLWNDTYPLGGNYWSDFDEPSEWAFDDYKGPNQNVTGSDGIVDNGTIGGGGRNPYIIDPDSQDNYPLIKPFLYMILYQGWNLISIPLIQQERDLTKVLTSIDGLYDAVQWYDITDTNDPWKHHKVGKPIGNDLTEINETMGFWIHITQPGDTIFRYNGTQPTVNQTITLHPGWNLVGYPSLTSYNRTEGLNNLTFGSDVDSIWTYNAGTQKWKELAPSDYFEIGRGYWVHAKIKCVWEVPL